MVGLAIGGFTNSNTLSATNNKNTINKQDYENKSDLDNSKMLEGLPLQSSKIDWNQLTIGYWVYS